MVSSSGFFIFSGNKTPKCNVKKLLYLLPLIFPFSIQAQVTQLPNGYSVSLTYASSFEYDPDNNRLTATICRNTYISLTPQTPLNASTYSLYSEFDVFIRNGNNSYQIWNVTPGNYIIKDGTAEVVKLNLVFDDPANYYELVLTDDQNNVIEDFSAENLNAKVLQAAVRIKSTSLLADPCDAYDNWSVNGTGVSDLSQVELQAGDEICVLSDGTEECTGGCYSWMERCFTVVPGTVTSLSGSAEKGIEVYPNPASTELRIGIPFTYERIEIFDSKGKKVLASDNSLTENEVLSIEHFQPGLYMLVVHTEKRSYQTSWIKSGN